jgi:hypothetical protein
MPGLSSSIGKEVVAAGRRLPRNTRSARRAASVRVYIDPHTMKIRVNP